MDLETLADLLSLVERIRKFAEGNKLEVQKRISKPLTCLQVKCQVKNNLYCSYQAENKACAENKAVYISCSVSYVCDSMEL